jgi:uncharacterized repeat protein (TIGR03803 family)
VQGFDGNFYGTTEAGGGTCANNPFASCGVAFKVTPTGTLSVLHEFCQGACTDGGVPYSGLVLSPSGNFYGTTTQDMVNHGGTLYQMTPTGTVTPVHSFSLANAEGTPYGAVTLANGGFYGISGTGGGNGDGMTYKITPSGMLTTLDIFNGTNGFEIPYSGVSLLQLPTGNFLGVTAYGTQSTNGCGSIFQMTPKGALTTVYGFANTSAQGCGPLGLVAGPNGNFYGTATGGGPANDGVIFELSRSGIVTVLHSFCSESNCGDGSNPNVGLLLGTDGNLYGTTLFGGANGQGVIYQISSGGTYQVLYNFCSQFGCTDGSASNGSLIQGTDGNFYGATSNGGGSGNGGTVFQLSMGLAPFVTTTPAYGKVSSRIAILGGDLSSASSVTFNGVAAQFKVEAPTLIVATVPSGATTGKVRVKTPNGTLVSNLAFRVRP